MLSMRDSLQIYLFSWVKSKWVEKIHNANKKESWKSKQSNYTIGKKHEQTFH